MLPQCKNDTNHDQFKLPSLIILLSVHREVCKNEFIIPLGDDLKGLYSDPEMCHSLRSQRTESVRPLMKMTEIGYVLTLHRPYTNHVKCLLNCRKVDVVV